MRSTRPGKGRSKNNVADVDAGADCSIFHYNELNPYKA